MQKRTTTTVRIVLTIALSSLLAFQAQAQERSEKKIVLEADTTYFMLENQFETGSPYLTESLKDELREIFTKKVLERFPNVKDITTLIYKWFGMTNPENWSPACKANNRWGNNANYPHAITSQSTLEECATVNEISLGWMRAQTGLDFALENGWVDPLRVETGVYGAVDSLSNGKPTRKTLLIAVIKPNSGYLADMPEIKAIKKHNQQQDVLLNTVIDSLNASIEQTNRNTEKINNSVSTQDQKSFSIGAKVTRFAGQYTPVGETGIPYGPLEFSLWSGGWKDYTAKLDEGDTTYNRFMIGGSVSYLWNLGSFRFGPRLGIQFTKDEVSPDCRVLFYSAMAGLSAEYNFAGNWSIYGDASWVTGFEDIQGDLDPDAGWFMPSAGIRYQVTFN